MSNYYYKTSHDSVVKKVGRIVGLFLALLGLFIVGYIFSPLIIWQLTLAPAFASSQINAPIPHNTLLTSMNIGSLVSSGLDNFSIDYTNAQNWYPTYHGSSTEPRESSYFLSIPRLGITNAFVSAIDTDLVKHLVSLSGTPIPPDKGNTVIFGHSTLPQLFNANDYKTIFANLHTIQIGDIIQVTVNNIVYTYKVFSITVVDPTDTSVLSQQYDDSYITIITCTPPGTIWKRLIVKAQLQKLSN